MQRQHDDTASGPSNATRDGISRLPSRYVTDFLYFSIMLHEFFRNLYMRSYFDSVLQI